MSSESVKTPKSFLSPSDSEEDAAVGDDESWEDAEADIEEITATCLFCAQELQSSNEVFQHCASVHNFDFAAVRKDLGLDFYGCIKLINYIRSEVAAGHVPDLSSPTEFLNDEKYLQPVVGDDALLFGLGDLEDDKAGGEEEDSARKIRDLEERLHRSEMENLRYRELMDKALAAKLAGDTEWQDPDGEYWKSCSTTGVHEHLLRGAHR